MNDREMAEEINTLVRNGMSAKDAAEQVLSQRQQMGVKITRSKRFEKAKDESST